MFVLEVFTLDVLGGGVKLFVYLLFFLDVSLIFFFFLVRFASCQTSVYYVSYEGSVICFPFLFLITIRLSLLFFL